MRRRRARHVSGPGKVGPSVRHFTASATDGAGVVSYRYYLDGVDQGLFTPGAGYDVPVDSLSEGSHTLTARGRDAAGNEYVQDAVGSAVEMCWTSPARSVGIGKPVHFHLHEGIPSCRGLRHFSFLTGADSLRWPAAGRWASMFGPSGLAAMRVGGDRACGLGRLVHAGDPPGRGHGCPLADTADLFARWRDLTNAERMNYWLSVLGENALLVSQPAELPRSAGTSLA